MNVFTIMIIVFIISICGYYIISDESLYSSQIFEEQSNEQEALESEQKRFEAQFLSDLSQIRQTSLELTVDKKINHDVLLDGDYSDDYALIDKGIELSSNYNRISYDYSSGKIFQEDYTKILNKLKLQYESYLEEITNHSWQVDITNHKKFLVSEYFKIKKEIAKLNH